MSVFEQHPTLLETLVGLGILLGSYLAARLLSALFGRLLAAAEDRRAGARLAAALKDPLTGALVLAGAFVALHRLPVQDRWMDRLDNALFVSGALLLTLALVRSYAILLRWYTTESRHAAAEGLASEFGPLLSKLGKLLIALLGTITVLHHFGINVASLVVSLGVGSLAVGLAAQDTLANMIAGFMLMLDRPFRIGDRIQLATGEVGDVEAIGMRSTRIKTLDETTLVVPNAALVKERVVNLTRPSRRITTRVEVGVAYGCDLAEARRILAEAALASEYTDASFTPLVLVTRFGDFAIHLRVVFWARDYMEQGLAASQVHEEIYRRLREAGIEIPFPTHRVIQDEPRQAAASEG